MEQFTYMLNILCTFKICICQLYINKKQLAKHNKIYLSLSFPSIYLSVCPSTCLSSQPAVSSSKDEKSKSVVIKHQQRAFSSWGLGRSRRGPGTTQYCALILQITLLELGFPRSCLCYCTEQKFVIFQRGKGETVFLKR